MPPPFNPLLVDSLPTGPTWENNSARDNHERSDHVDQTFQPLRQITERLLSGLSIAQVRFATLQLSLSEAQDSLNGFSQTWEAFQRQVIDVLNLSEEALIQTGAQTAGSEGLSDTGSSLEKSIRNVEENIRAAQAVARWRWRVRTPQSDVADPPGGVIEPIRPRPPIQVLQADAPDIQLSNNFQIRTPIRPIQVPEADAPNMVGTTITSRPLGWGYGRINPRRIFPIEPLPERTPPVFTRDDAQDEYALLDDLDSGEINEVEAENTAPPEWEPNPSVFSVEELDVGSEPFIMSGIDPAIGLVQGEQITRAEVRNRRYSPLAQVDTSPASRTIWDFID